MKFFLINSILTIISSMKYIKEAPFYVINMWKSKAKNKKIKEVKRKQNNKELIKSKKIKHKILKKRSLKINKVN
jgi:hypothetical protein